MNKNQRKEHLEGLGAEVLADVLLELAEMDARVEDRVERMIATPEENLGRFRKKLAGLKRAKRFLHWGESATLAETLESVLCDLKSSVTDPRTGVELVAAFYETDEKTFGRCDDSSGHVGNVYHIDARELFVHYASRCEDKGWLRDLVVKLNATDPYGVRDVLIDCAAEYLPEAEIRRMISQFQAQAERESEMPDKRHWYIRIESLARQIRDASLFEKTRIASWGELNSRAYVEIAQAYLESGDPGTALTRLERVDASPGGWERDRLLYNVYAQLGEKEQQTEVAWRLFRRDRCGETLNQLLSIVGKDQRAQVVGGEIQEILAEPGLSNVDAQFLAETEHFEELNRYLLDRRDQLDGDWYGELLPLAKMLESQGLNLAASAVYRALLDSILRRAQSKTYFYGVRYLKKLDGLAQSVVEWPPLESHTDYVAGLRKAHGRKKAFWSRYEDD